MMKTIELSAEDMLEKAFAELSSHHIIKRQRALAIIKAAGERGLEKLLEKIAAGNHVQQSYLIRQLPLFCQKDKPLQRRLLEAVKTILEESDSRAAGKHLAFLIQRMTGIYMPNERLLRGLLRYLLDEDAKTRAYFISLFDWNHFLEALPYLEMLREDENEDVAQDAANALYRIENYYKRLGSASHLAAALKKQKP